MACLGHKGTQGPCRDTRQVPHTQPTSPPLVPIITEATCNRVLLITVREKVTFLFPNALQEGQSTLHVYATELLSHYFVFFAVKKMQKEILHAGK